MEHGEKFSHCSNPNCKLLETGSCAEGHVPLASCPNVGIAGNDDLAIYDEDIERHSPTETGENYISLPSGEALNLAGIEAFLRWRPANFITIVGDRDSGKSTLVCALYDRLLRGPFSGWGFAGSHSLVALERRAHFSRADSGKSVPDTPRTSLMEGLQYFHLALMPQKMPQMRIDLLISDRAGETYQQSRSDTSIIASLPEISQADRLLILLDGRRLSNVIERANAVQSVRQTLRVLLDNAAVNTTSIIQIVTTKFDLIEASDDVNDIKAILSRFEERLFKDFGSRLRELTFWKIAARAPCGSLAPAYGLDHLLMDWVSEKPRQTLSYFPELDLKSEFDQLLVRTQMEMVL